MKTCIFFILSLFFLSGTVAAAEAEQELFGSYTLFSFARNKYKNTLQLQLGLVDPMSENLGMRYGYQYAKVQAKRRSFPEYGGTNDLDSDRARFTLHSFSIGAQQDVGHTLFVWGATALALWQGEFIFEDTGVAQEYGFKGRYVMTEGGLGQRWRFGDNYSIGVDWLVLSGYIYRQVSLSDPDGLRAAKGPYFQPKNEIKQVVDEVTTLRSLSFRVSLFL